MSVDKNWLRSHARELHGVLAESGGEWRLLDVPATKEDHQGHIQVLRDEGALDRVRDTRLGVVWRTTPAFEEAFRSVCEDVDGLDSSEAFVATGQTTLVDFGRASV